MHEPHRIKRDASFEEILSRVQARCKLHSAPRIHELVHRSQADHDYLSGPLHCTACGAGTDGRGVVIFTSLEH